MAAYNKFNSGIADLLGAINLGSDTLNLLLTNTAPNVADTVVDTTTATCTIKATSLAAEIAAGNGYVKIGASITITTNSQSGGTYTLAGNQIVWTASAGTIGPFRYVTLFDITAATTATRPVIAWFDYGSSITLNSGETFTVQFNSANPGTIFTAS